MQNPLSTYLKRLIENMPSDPRVKCWRDLLFVVITAEREGDAEFLRKTSESLGLDPDMPNFGIR